MKTKTLAEMFGINKKFRYDNALYEHNSKKFSSQDFLEEKKLITREGHLD
jgi:hypothetical protein